MFLAVLLALCTHSAITWARISAMPEPTPPAQPAPTRAPPRMPRYVGPIEANAIGADTACMSGRTAVRIPHGWRTTSQACIATTQ
ncbi:hypothetical protein CMZ84_14525 [Lysobacteraceae bacterium NML93-0399]|nr:hypothetical protein CMZ84_14525 [Xanthomonadaceae bacterium NML93-0399]